MSVKVFWKRFSFELVGWVKQVAFLSADGHHPVRSLRAWWNRKEGEGEFLLLLLDLRHPSSFALWQRCSWFLGFRTQAYTISAHAQAFQWGLNSTTSFPGTPACRWTAGRGTAWPPRWHDSISIINLSLSLYIDIGIDVSYWLCFSGELYVIDL